jgi:hypothetical protein
VTHSTPDFGGGCETYGTKSEEQAVLTRITLAILFAIPALDIFAAVASLIPLH